MTPCCTVIMLTFTVPLSRPRRGAGACCTLIRANPCAESNAVAAALHFCKHIRVRGLEIAGCSQGKMAKVAVGDSKHEKAGAGA